jgi:hypothetical protein
MDKEQGKKHKWEFLLILETFSPASTLYDFIFSRRACQDD